MYRSNVNYVIVIQNNYENVTTLKLIINILLHEFPVCYWAVQL